MCDKSSLDHRIHRLSESATVPILTVKLQLFVFAECNSPIIYLASSSLNLTLIPLPPPPYPKFYMITIVLNYPYGDFNTQEKLQNKGYAKIGGANKVYYGRCANWLFYQYHLSKGKVYLSQSTFSRPHLERRVYWILTSPLTLFLIW